METRKGDRARQLPEGWARPVPDTGRMLFSNTVDDALAELRVTHDEAHRWQQSGWLSFSIDETCKLDLSQQDEIEFVRTLAISGLGEVVINHLLQGLPRPFAYNSRFIAYNFEYGWVMLVPEEPNEEQDPHDVVEEHVADWLEKQASDGNTETLRDLRDQILEHLDEILDKSDTDQSG